MVTQNPSGESGYPPRTSLLESRTQLRPSRAPRRTFIPPGPRLQLEQLRKARGGSIVTTFSVAGRAAVAAMRLYGLGGDPGVG